MSDRVMSKSAGMLLLAVLLWLGCAQAHLTAVEPQVATGFQHTVYLAPDGTVWAWGDNGFGQLGDGTTTDSAVPVKVLNLSNIIAVSAGYFHNLALTADGKVFAWGYNAFGQLGDATTTSSSTPVQSGTITGIAQIACGGYHSLALALPSGTVYCWGRDTEDQIGNGATTTDVLTPFSPGSGYRRIAGGSLHSLGITFSGTVNAWGSNNLGQLGDGTTTSRATPTPMAGGIADAMDIAAGDGFTLIHRANGYVWSCGNDSVGQLGNGGTASNLSTPTDTFYRAQKIIAGYQYSAFIWFGSVWVSGNNNQAQGLATPGAPANRLSFTQVYSASCRPQAFVGGPGQHLIIPLANGQLVGWGDNSQGQLGNGTNTDFESTVKTVSAAWSLDHIIKVGAGYEHSIALKADGTVWAWGRDNFGQLGDDITSADKSTAVQVFGLTDVIDIGAGSYFNLALRGNGAVMSWGFDGQGSLGDDAAVLNKFTPVSVSGLSNIRAIGVGGFHAFSIDEFGAVKGWGYNPTGQLGDGTTSNRNTPVVISGLAAVLQIDGGGQHTVALMSNGEARTMGSDSSGQLGNDVPNTNSSTPVAVVTGSGSVTPITGFFSVAAGANHSVASRSSGATRAWGNNDAGQLGNGTTTSSSFVVGGISAGKGVSSGGYYGVGFSLALLTNGAVLSVGSNANGQLGNNSTVDSSSGVTVNGISNICQMSAGDEHALALGADGTVYAWGNNGSGRLGNGVIGGNQLVPTTVNQVWKPQITVSVPDASADEAGLATGFVRFTRTAAMINNGAQTILYTVGGAATSGDRQALSGTVVIPPGAGFADVLVTPIDDQIDEDSESVTLTLASSSYYTIGAPNAGSVQIADNDTANILYSPGAGLATTESGGTATFSVVLETQPTADVVVTLVSSNIGEGTVDTNGVTGGLQSTLTFTSGDWNIAQTVTLTGVNDLVDDGDVGYSISDSIATSDTKYTNVAAGTLDVAATNIDDDAAAFVINPDSGMVISESGGTTTFTISLATQPTVDVTLNLSSSDDAIATVSPNVLSFSSVSGGGSGWDVPHVVTITGTANGFIDGNRYVQILTDVPGTNTDPAYKGLNPTDVNCVVLDDDVAALVVDTTAISATEGGAFGTYNIKLGSRPFGTNTVTVRVSSFDGQCTVDTDLITPGNQDVLTFDESNYNGFQLVKVTAVADNKVEGPHTAVLVNEIDASVPGAEPAYYSSLTTPSISVSITDNDVAGITVSESGGVTTVSEATPSTADTYSVVLNTQPQAAARLVKDVRTGDFSPSPSSGNPGKGALNAGFYYFPAATDALGTELWRSDGTASGTTMVKDINIGSGSSNPHNFIAVGGTVYFIAYDGFYGDELWATDGTANGTRLVKDITPGSSYGTYSNFTAYLGALYFFANDPVYGSELWCSDGTFLGTYPVIDLNPGSSSGVDVYTGNLLVAGGGKLYFSGDDGVHGNELFQSNGTAAGTTMVRDLTIGAGGSTISDLAYLGGTLYFSATVGATGAEPYTSDGTFFGTQQLKNVNAAPFSGSNPAQFTLAGGTVYFIATTPAEGRELWKTNGTAIGTSLVAEINAGSTDGYIDSLVSCGSYVAFGAYSDGDGGYELFRSDGTGAGTIPLSPTSFYSIYFLTYNNAPVNPQIVFEMYESTSGFELWASDGTALGTRIVQDLMPGTYSSDPNYLMAFPGGTVAFSAYEDATGRELYDVDPTATTIALIKDIEPATSPSHRSSYPEEITVTNTKVFFRAYDDATGYELYVSDGSSLGTQLTNDIVPGPGDSYPKFITRLGNSDKVVYVASDTFGDQELYVSDGTPLGTHIIADLNPSGSSSPRYLARFGSQVIFRADDAGGDNELYITDGTSITVLPQINPTGSSLSSYSDQITQTLDGSVVFFAAYEPVNGTQLWRTDGVSVTFVADIDPGSSDSGFYYMTAFKDGVLFTAYDGLTYQLYFSNGATTQVVAGNAYPWSKPVILGGIAYFQSDGTDGRELWQTDGTSASLFMDLEPGPSPSYPDSFVDMGSYFVFTANTSAAGGPELWRSDGTVPGTYIVKDISGPLSGSYPQYLVAAGGFVFYNAYNQKLGTELWRSDGTAAGTVLLKDFIPGEYSGYPQYLASNGSMVAFAADDGVVGTELWIVGPGEVGVAITIADGQTTADADAVTAGNQVQMTFTGSNYDVPQTVSVYAVDDALFENNPHPGAITHVATSAGPVGDVNYDSIPVSPVTATITDNDLTPPTIAFAVASQSALESIGTMTVTITQSALSGKVTSIPFSISGTATGGSDYTNTASPVTIPIGQTSVTITLTITDDLLNEANETIQLTLGMPTNATVGGISVHTATITDDDSLPVANFTAATSAPGEAAGTRTQVVTAQLSAVSGTTVTIPVTLSGTAAIGAGNDYTISGTTITITPGSPSGSVTITVNDDALDEAGETVIVTMGTPTNATKGATNVHTATIADDDATPTVTFTAASQSAGENIGAMIVTAQLSAVSGRTVTVPFTLSGTATSVADYSNAASPITIPAGSSSANLALTVVNDTLDENDETIIVTMGAPTNATQGATTVHTATITDDDATPTVTFTAATSSTGEAALSQNITVQLSAASGLPVSVPYTLSGTATVGSGNDYTIAPATPVTIAAGLTSAILTITINNDTLDENNETVIATFGTPSNAGLGATTVHTCTISDDDATPTVNFEANTASNESAGTVTVTATLSAASGLPVTVPFAVNGSSTATGTGVDYSFASSSIAIAAGSTTGSVNLTITNDTTDEANETVIMDMGSPTNANQGATTTHTRTITDDDAAPTVAWSAVGQSSAGETGTMTVTATLSAISGKNVSVPYTVTGTATNGGDFTITASPLSISAGATSASATITILTDSIDDDAETVIVTMDPPTNATISGGSQVHTAIITDDDARGLTFVESSGSTTALEGDPGPFDSYQVSLATQPTATVTVTVTVADGQTIVDTDGVAPADQNTLTFTTGNWNVAQTVSVRAVDDGAVEGAHSGVLPHACSGGDYGAVAGNVSVSITDNDAPGVILTEVGGTTVLTEGGASDTYTVRLATDPGTNVDQVTVSITPDGQLTRSPVTMTFTGQSGLAVVGTTSGWDVPQTVTLTAVDDSVDEPDGHLGTVTHAVTASTNLAAYPLSLTIPSLSAAITDNDAAPSLAIAGVSIAEGSGGGTVAATVTVTMTGTSSATVTVNYGTADNTATSADYTTTSGTLTWTPGQTGDKTFTVDVVKDDLDEVNETIDVNLTGASNATLSTATDVVTITDDDAAPTIAFQAATSTPNEGDGTALVTVELSAASGKTVTVGFTAGGSATGADYSLSASPVTFAPGETTKDITVTLIDDSLDEAAETLTLTLSGPTNATVSGIGVHTATIADNDATPTVTWTVSGQTITEGDSGTQNITITAQVSAVSGQDIDVPYTVTGTATGSGTDYSVTASPVTITAGSSSINATITVQSDVLDEDDETVIVTMGSPTNATQGAVTVHTATITDDDALPSVSISPVTASGLEDAGTNIDLTITLSAVSGRDVTVPFTFNGSSTADGADFTASASPLVIPAGSLTGTLSIDPIADAFTEPDETVIVDLGTPTNATLGTASSTVTILNDEGATSVAFTAASSSVAEGSLTPASVLVQLSALSAVNVDVPLIVTGTASNGTDYVISTTTVTILAGSLSATTQITPIQDVISESDETVILTIGTPVPGTVTVGAQSVHTVTITDDDTPAVTITESSGATAVVEGGTTDSYTVVLTSIPTSTVTVTPNAGSQVTVSPTSVQFDNTNWNLPQTITVTAVDDAVAETPPQTLVISHAVTGGGTYAGISVAAVSVDITDNDTLALVIGHAGPITVTEGSLVTDSYTVALASQPTANVTLTLTPDVQQSLSTTTLTFTTLNWLTPQTVTVTVVDDAIDEASPHVGTITNSAVGGNYTGSSLAATLVQVVDNDNAGVTVLPSTGLSTTEAGGVAVFTVVLDSQPTASVSMTLTSSAVTEGTVSPSSLTFTPANWFIPRLVFVSGVNDSIDDGDVTYTVVTGNCTISGGADANYNGSVVTDVSLTNVDNDSAGVVVTPPGSPTVDEGNLATTFNYTVTLTSQPTGTVTITPVTDGQTTVTPASRSFTSADWNTLKTFTVAAVNDSVDEASPHTSIISHNVSGAGYAGVTANNVTVSVIDNDTRNVAVSPTVGLIVAETGTTDAFTVALATQPLTNVSIALTSLDLSEGTVSPTIMTFTPANWNTPQTATVRGVDDSVKDGPQLWLVDTGSSSSDANYASLAVLDVSVTTTDDDNSGITVTAGSLATSEGGLTSSFTVVLDSQPIADVTIPILTSDATEATVSPASVVFTSGNWNIPQIVTATGVNDDVDDDDQSFSIVTQPATTSDPNYVGVDAADVSGINADNDARGVTITQSGGFTSVSEAGSTDGYTVVLDSQPTATVTITVVPDVQVSVSPLTLTFTTTDWNVPQSITVAAIDDLVAEGSHSGIITHAVTGGDYASLAVADVSALIADNDIAGVLATPSLGLTTTEAGGTATFDLTLNSEPTGNVVVDLTSDNTAAGTVFPASVTFTALDWFLPQTITVTGINDATPQVNAPVTYHVDALVNAGSTADATYAALATPTQVTLANNDDDSAAILVTAVGTTQTTEAGGIVNATVELTSQPTGTVTITVTSSDTSEGDVPPATVLNFTGATWNIPQPVVVTGQDDALDDGDVIYQLHAAVTVTSDVNFNLQTFDVPLTNLDDDSTQIIVTPVDSVTDELGDTASFTVVLSSQPNGVLTIPVSSSLPGQGTPSTSLLTFTDADWFTAQTVTVTGADGDGFQTATVPYSIVLAAATNTNTGSAYHNLNPADVALTNLQVNNPPTLAAISDLTINEDAGLQTVSLGGISTGQAGETQILSVTVASSNVAVIPLPIVTYTSPANTGSIQFTPVPQASGFSDITVTVTDDAAYGPAKLVNRTFRVTVNSVNDAPAFAVGAATVTVAEDSGAFALGSAWATGISPGPSEGGQTLTFAVTTSNDALFAVLPTLDEATGDLTFTPAAEASGSAVITAVLSDDGGTANGGVDQVTHTFTIVVTAVNDPPAFDPIADIDVDEDDPTEVVTITGISTGPLESAQSITWAATSDNPGLLGPITVSPLTATTAHLDFTPVLNQSGVAIVTVTATDDGVPAAALTRTFTVTVNAVNDAPVLSGTLAIVNMPLRGDITLTTAMLNASDVESLASTLIVNLTLKPGQGDLLNGAQVLDPTDGDLTNDSFLLADLIAGQIHYLHGGGGNSDGFAITVSDGVASSALAAFNITINRQPPSITLDAGTVTYTENQELPPAQNGTSTRLIVSPGALALDQGVGGLVGGNLIVDVTGGMTLTEEFGLNPGLITVAGNVVSHTGTPIGLLITGGTPGVRLEVSLNASATPALLQDLIRAVTFRDYSDNPAAGTRPVVFTVLDGDGNFSAPQTRGVVVVPVNDAPDAGLDFTLATPENISLVGTILGSDAESNPITYSVPGFGAPGGPIRGNITLNALTGAFTYAPLIGQSGTDTFIVTVTDAPGLATDTVTVTVIITGNSIPRPWIISDPPMEVQDLDIINYPFTIDASEIAGASSGHSFTLQVTGSLIAGTVVNVTPIVQNGPSSTLYSGTLVIDPPPTGFGSANLDLGIVVTDTTAAPNSAAIQPLLIRILSLTGSH